MGGLFNDYTAGADSSVYRKKAEFAIMLYSLDICRNEWDSYSVN